MFDLNAIAVFAKVVQTGSFTSAARALDMPKSTVSQRVSELEERLGARLLQRTTRRLNLTDAGRIYHDHCVRIVADVEEADGAVTSLQERPRGRLRITIPASTQFLGPTLAEFLEQYEGVQLEVVCTDRFVNLVEESFDLAIRAGVLADSTLIVRTLGTIQYILVASPRYLKKHGRPRTPDGLADHACVVFSVGPHPKVWRLARATETQEISVSASLAVNDLDMVGDAVVRGVGIAMLPAFRCIDDLRAKRVERILPDWRAQSTPVQAVYPSSRHLSPKVKTLLDHLQRLRPAPWATTIP